jgi:Immunity protein 17
VADSIKNTRCFERYFMSNVLVCLLSIGAGAFCLAASFQNWDWFFNNWRARIMVSIFGRGGARIFYGILGGFLVLLGLFIGVRSLF